MARRVVRRRKLASVGHKEMVGPQTRVKLIGVGGGGGNAVSRMAENFVRGVEFIAINTDQQDLDQCNVRRKLYIGRNLTRGLGTGMNPDIGQQAAEENRSEIAEALRDADLVFITAGFGGGTGTGATPVVAEVAKQSGALTIAVVTKPFAFEGTQRARIATEGLQKIKDKVDALIVVPNDRIFSIIDKDTPILKAFQAIDEVLRNALLGIVELVVSAGIINVDFADVRAIIKESGSAIVGIGYASGQDRAMQAVNQALSSPLLEVNAEGAHGVLLGISGGRDLKMSEVNEAAKLVAQTVDPTARIIFGAYHDRKLKPGQIKVTLIATGFSTNGNRSLFTDPFADREPLPSLKAEPVGNDFPESMRSSATPPVPAFLSNEPKLEKSSPADAKKRQKDSNDMWDIPTFLRKRKR